jgi:hypothetical protein
VAYDAQHAISQRVKEKVFLCRCREDKRGRGRECKRERERKTRGGGARETFARYLAVLRSKIKTFALRVL